MIIKNILIPITFFFLVSNMIANAQKANLVGTIHKMYKEVDEEMVLHNIQKRHDEHLMYEVDSLVKNNTSVGYWVHLISTVSFRKDTTILGRLNNTVLVPVIKLNDDIVNFQDGDDIYDYLCVDTLRNYIAVKTDEKGRLKGVSDVVLIGDYYDKDKYFFWDDSTFKDIKRSYAKFKKYYPDNLVYMYDWCIFLYIDNETLMGMNFKGKTMPIEQLIKDDFHAYIGYYQDLIKMSRGERPSFLDD